MVGKSCEIEQATSFDKSVFCSISKSNADIWTVYFQNLIVLFCWEEFGSLDLFHPALVSVSINEHLQHLEFAFC